MDDFDSLIALSSSILEGIDPSASLVLGVRGMMLALYLVFNVPSLLIDSFPGSLLKETGGESLVYNIVQAQVVGGCLAPIQLP